ncbi:MAG: polyphosphate polymerase domain-containing protein [Lachnospiraceae bacterium]|nr:polyphosphate polymerase domain-containing protein [Lachnospiraceae bacterium]
MEAKYRNELKYVVSAAQIATLKSQVASIMQPDVHAGADGKYCVRSLYFDDYDNRCYYENENGTDVREKFRIRTYDQSPAFIALECKRKERGKTLKTAIQLTEGQAQQIMDGAPMGELSDMEPLLRKMKLQMEMRLLRPKVIVEYDRVPFVYREGNVRVTFDLNVSSCNDCQRFWKKDLPKRPIMPPGMHLMEVKFDDFLPDFIYRSLNLGGLRQTTYSKYYLCRKHTLA